MDNHLVTYFPTQIFHLLLHLLHLLLLLLHLLHLLLLHLLQVLLQASRLLPDDRAEQVVSIPEINIHMFLTIGKKTRPEEVLQASKFKIPQVPLQRSGLLAPWVKYGQALVCSPWVIDGQARAHVGIDHVGIPFVSSLPPRAC